MKCPKCGYVGFEVRDRCRHCGYDFSFVALPSGDAPFASTAATTEDLEGGPDELFGAGAASQHTPENLGFVDVDAMDAAADGDDPAGEVTLTPPAPAVDRGDLFGAAPPPAPPPLAVRKAPERQRTRTTQVFRRPESRSLLESPAAAIPEAPAVPEAAVLEPAALWRRAAAGVTDLLLLGGIDIAVLYFTVRLAGLSLRDAALVPPIPFGAFLLGLNVGYLCAFTASGGQTLGKMAWGVRAVSSEGPITVGQALLRVTVALAGGLLLGLGYLPVLFGSDRRAVHDRVANTRVVRAVT